MAKKTEDRNRNLVTKVGAGLPAWLEPHAENDESTTDMAEYRVLARLKVVQSMTEQDLKKAFGEGTVIVSPGNVKVFKDGDDPVTFVPVFFWTEFCQWSDLKDKQSPTILAKTFDKSSELAEKARDPNRREEEYPGGFKSRYVEHLNFACYIYDKEHDLYATPVCLSFFKGEFNTGKGFVSSIMLRRAPLWSTVWTLQSNFRDHGDRKWYGIDVTNASPPFIDEGDAEFFMNEHETLKSEFADGLLGMATDDEDKRDPEDPDIDDTEM